METTTGRAMGRRYLTYDEAAGHMGISRWTIWRAVKHGELPAVRVGAAVRFDVADLDRYMSERKR